jgi:KDO2-lipid IV(A) lauroyltransferase
MMACRQEFVNPGRALERRFMPGCYSLRRGEYEIGEPGNVTLQFRPYFRRARSVFFRLLYHGLLAPVCGRLSWQRTQRIGAWLGGVVWRRGQRDRRRSLEHLSIAFPELDTTRREEIGEAASRHLLTSVMEVLHLLRRPREEAQSHVEIVGFEHIEQILEEKKTIVVLTAHCGNWELLSTTNASHDLGLAGMARASDDPFLAQLLVDFRLHLGSETIVRGSKGSSRQLLRLLRRRGALGLLIDQDIETDGVWVPFFGRLAHTPRAAADLAQRLGARVVPAFSERLEDGSHRVTFHPPLELPECAVEATALMTQAIEQQIRRRPEQWVWQHRRWRRRPPDPAATPEE